MDTPRERPANNVKVTRDDWLDVARDILISDGVAEVKVLAIGTRLGVSRSSFYWYFKSRQDLLDALIADWEGRNTAVIEEHCALDAATITEAVGNFFRCFLDPDLFDQGLDFAVREWSRRDGRVRKRIDLADNARIAAITAMFSRFGYAPDEADTRARVLYFMQLGYHALDQTEPLSVRIARTGGYLAAFTGQAPRPGEVEALDAFARARLGPRK